MSADQRPLAIFLMGPTASGKTALACQLADCFPIGLISVDSALVYRGMDIGTAKPDADTLRQYPHALVDIRDPVDAYSAADFATDARAAMAGVTGSGRIPLLVGGTGLYFRALQRGLSPLPQADPPLRARLAEQAHTHGWASLHARLAQLDSAAASRIRAGDAQRIQRALEVIELTGRPLSSQQVAGGTPFPWRVLKLALMPADRGVLHQRITQRFDAMLAAGFLDEVRRMQMQQLPADLPAWRAVGYRQAREFLEGQGDAADFRARAIAATRQLAKRQITWLRSEADARRLDADADMTPRHAHQAVQQFTQSSSVTGEK